MTDEELEEKQAKLRAMSFEETVELNHLIYDNDYDAIAILAKDIAKEIRIKRNTIPGFQAGVVEYMAQQIIKVVQQAKAKEEEYQYTCLEDYKKMVADTRSHLWKDLIKQECIEKSRNEGWEPVSERMK